MGDYKNYYYYYYHHHHHHHHYYYYYFGLSSSFLDFDYTKNFLGKLWQTWKFLNCLVTSVQASYELFFYKKECFLSWMGDTSVVVCLFLYFIDNPFVLSCFFTNSKTGELEFLNSNGGSDRKMVSRI